MDPADIAILTAEADDRFEATKYLIHGLSQRWRSIGLRVAVLRGTRSFVPARLLIPHIDVTVRPAEYQSFLRSYRRAVNRELTDVSKSSFSENLLERDSGYSGPVIVKTNRNYGGLPERRAGDPAARPSLVRKLRSRWSALSGTRPFGVAWDRVEWLEVSSYPVFRRLRDVPRGVFENPGLVVERFSPEVEGDFFCVRYAYVLGPRQITLRLKSRQPVIRGLNAEACEEVEAPPELERWRRRLRLDYGKIDFVVRQGNPVMLDVNPTPASTTLERWGFLSRVVERLGDGVSALADGPEPVGA